jgi:hypothetical protein
MTTRKRTKTEIYEAKKAVNITKHITRKKWKIPSNVVLAYFSKNLTSLPSIPNYGGYTIQEDILRVRLILWQTKKRFEIYKKVANEQRIPILSENTLIKILEDSKQKKYRDRDSPPFSANQLCNAILKGNDGKVYKSTKNTKGICTWIRDIA